MNLRQYLKTLKPADLAGFAARCETSVAHLRNIAGGFRTCGEYLAINIERESQGKVTCEEMRDDVDWAYLRGTPKPEPVRAA